jgi:hypothetical protein
VYHPRQFNTGWFFLDHLVKMVEFAKEQLFGVWNFLLLCGDAAMKQALTAEAAEVPRLPRQRSSVIRKKAPAVVGRQSAQHSQHVLRCYQRVAANLLAFKRFRQLRIDFARVQRNQHRLRVTRTGGAGTPPQRNAGFATARYEKPRQYRPTRQSPAHENQAGKIACCGLQTF